MSKVTEQEVSDHMNEWLVEQVPSTIYGGIAATKLELTEFIRGKTFAPLSVKVWRNFEDERFFNFSYHTCDDHSCLRGDYQLDTRFWDTREGDLPEE